MCSISLYIFLTHGNARSNQAEFIVYREHLYHNTEVSEVKQKLCSRYLLGPFHYYLHTTSMYKQIDCEGKRPGDLEFGVMDYLTRLYGFFFVFLRAWVTPTLFASWSTLYHRGVTDNRTLN